MKANTHAKSEVDDGLTLCMLGKFSCICCFLQKLFKINFFLKEIVQEYYQRISVRWLDLDLGPDCLQTTKVAASMKQVKPNTLHLAMLDSCTLEVGFHAL